MKKLQYQQRMLVACTRTLALAVLSACGYRQGSSLAPRAERLPAPVAVPAPDPAQVWHFGTLAANDKVADELLVALTITPAGHKFWKSNNPEIFTSTGWLMQNSHTDATRGGQADQLTGCSSAYFFHINQSGGAAFVHLLASNPQAGSITLSAKGSTYSNASKPLGGKATGPSYAVSGAWRDGRFSVNFSARALAAGHATEVARVAMAANNMADGRFEICSTGGIYLYTVVTTSGAIADAISASQGAAADGVRYATGPATYGREGGVYRASEMTGLTNVVLPPGSGQYLGFAFNTTAKYKRWLPEQTSAASSRLSDSASRTYGNYGHKFDTTLRLFNTSSAERSVRISFASSYTAASNTPSFTFNSPASFNGKPLDLWTTPTQPRQVIGSYPVPANSYFDARLLVYIAGLGVTNQQLIVEAL